MMTEVTKRQTVFAGRILDVGLEEHRLPDGRISRFEIVRHPGGAAVLPVMADGRVLLIRQFRPAVDRMVYEIPAGRLEPDEDAESCVRRELAEEAGYAAALLEPLGGLWSAVGFCDEYIALYLARGLTPVGQALEEDEVIELSPMSLEEALARLDRDEILDGKTQLALLRYSRMHGGGWL